MSEVEVLHPNCFLLRDLLSPQEQTRLFDYIQQNDKTPWNDLPRAMSPKPKTLIFGDAQPTLKYEIGEKSLVNDMVERAAEIVMHRSRDSTASTMVEQLKRRQRKSLSMAAIRYEAPDACFPPHVDHCPDSLVFLASLGCTARFMIKGPDMEEKLAFDFRSGDLLVFDASSEARILHGVMGVEEGSCPDFLENFSILRGHRYGVQCRLRF